jgi:hypothetical protein
MDNFAEHATANESAKTKHRQRVRLGRESAVRMDMFQGGKFGYLVQGELREVDIEAGQRPNVGKARKCIEKFGDENGMFHWQLQNITGRDVWHSNHEHAYEWCYRI